MRILALVLSLLIALSSPVFATCAGADLRAQLAPDVLDRIEARAARIPYAEGNLWRAQKGAAVIHILGTVHLGDRRITPSIERLRPLVEGAELVLLEITQAEQIRMQNDPGLILMPGSRTLPSMMSDEAWDEIAEALKDRGFPPIMAARMKPFFLSGILSIPPCAMTGLHSNEGVDATIESMALAKGIPSRSLESLDEVIQIIDAFPMDLQIAMLSGSLPRPDLPDDMLETLIAAYLREMVADGWLVMRELGKDAAFGGKPEFAAIMDEIDTRLLVERNRLWIPRLLAAAGPKPIFAAVGAAHLSGDQGVLNLLAQEGYTLTRLPF
ncbi:MAG: TraB/GumN family protein [Rhodobacteraceae bacterium]|nr:TraB/GumN family protein [Paracoccaceae bacterium]